MADKPCVLSASTTASIAPPALPLHKYDAQQFLAHLSGTVATASGTVGAQQFRFVSAAAACDAAHPAYGFGGRLRAMVEERRVGIQCQCLGGHIELCLQPCGDWGCTQTQFIETASIYLVPPVSKEYERLVTGLNGRVMPSRFNEACIFPGNGGTTLPQVEHRGIHDGSEN